MIFVKRAVLLLLVVVAAIGTNAQPGPEDCDGLSKRLPTKDLHKVFGDWVLVWSVSDSQHGWDLLENLSSSHVKLQLLPDNKTIMANERNMFPDKTCSKYFFNLSMPSDPSDSDHHTLYTGVGTVEKDGVVLPYDDSGKVDLYETCSDCLVVVYKGSLSRFLLIYRREGQHRDVEQLKAAHGDHHELAECLGFPHDKPFSYDGAADYCHKKPSPSVEPEQS
ncbi:saxitoxin and tetrodotoxin-binding protein 1-like [Micropterus dolomieu]|uniref:saxitoxin and tetrodotoxin-binding protein 1-like n=1 Tax=Micropterus dolomieu TaxID=147949 RepID=UPI001E8D7AC1|nr:saxitoxin and tetrodotoxin-binding protein 1-like [Micropterus dolomieu]